MTGKINSTAYPTPRDLRQILGLWLCMALFLAVYMALPLVALLAGEFLGERFFGFVVAVSITVVQCAVVFALVYKVAKRQEEEGRL